MRVASDKGVFRRHHPENLAGNLFCASISSTKEVVPACAGTDTPQRSGFIT